MTATLHPWAQDCSPDPVLQTSGESPTTSLISTFPKPAVQEKNRDGSRPEPKSHFLSMGKPGEPPRDQCPGATPSLYPPPAVSRFSVAFVWPYPAAKPVGKLRTQWCGGSRKIRLLWAPLTQRPEARASSIESLVHSPLLPAPPCPRARP